MRAKLQGRQEWRLTLHRRVASLICEKHREVLMAERAGGKI